MTLSIEKPIEQLKTVPMELEIGQRVMVLQTKREKPEAHSTSRIGELVCEVSTIRGTITALPTFSEHGELTNTLHVAQGERQPTYIVPLEPVTIMERDGKADVARELHFQISPM